MTILASSAQSKPSQLINMEEEDNDDFIEDGINSGFKFLMVLIYLIFNLLLKNFDFFRNTFYFSFYACFHEKEYWRLITSLFDIGPLHGFSVSVLFLFCLIIFFPALSAYETSLFFVFSIVGAYISYQIKPCPYLGLSVQLLYIYGYSNYALLDKIVILIYLHYGYVINLCFQEGFSRTVQNYFFLYIWSHLFRFLYSDVPKYSRYRPIS